MLFRFYCDESYDGNFRFPNTLTISGYFADEVTWGEVEEQWRAINARYGVQCFHATALNRGSEEYQGWSRDKRIQYSAELLAIINAQKARLVAYNCGMKPDAYRRIISEEGRHKLGPPWFACFKSCIAMIAQHMETLPREDSVSVVVERGSGFDVLAVDFFGKLAANPKFPYRHRLKTCIAIAPSSATGLELADLMAFEYFKRLHHQGSEMRIPLQLIRKSSNYVEGFFGEDTFKKMKEGIESAVCGPGELVIIPTL